jgi:hypothetical protein
VEACQALLRYLMAQDEQTDRINMDIEQQFPYSYLNN